ncbi:polymer-forming cytoskeletal protein [Brevibacillus humidisoli]|uniref:bactofilin family protein n=1 Tax=Brevibacillus humidisoli TaxID=2895522 RepID=UPI001E31A7C5|nr:polymer-forming cytoskeletal protein [Brevibacillus humidisoli]UFJ39966.1 polymer-forming cytoskeletal protein [Brevibacillus humidisoli]
MKNRIRMLLLVFALLAISGTTCFAFQAVSQETYVLANGETHIGDLFVTGRKVVIEGHVQGDIYSFAESLQISGKVTGDVITFSNDTVIRGEIDGDIRAFTRNLTIDGHVTRSTTVFTQYLNLSQSGEIGRNVLAFSQTVDLLGRLGGEINGTIADMRITGEIGRGITMLRVGQLQIEPSAKINGDVRYMSHQEASIAPGAQITGEVAYTQLEPEPKESPTWPILLVVMSVISTVLLWLVIRFLFPKTLLSIQRTLDEKTLGHFGVGILLLLAVPMLTVILLITIIGIPVAVTLVVVVGVLLFVAKIFVGTWAGLRLAERFQWRIPPLLTELIGVIGLSLLVHLPFAGWLVAIAVWMIFLGAVAATVRRVNRSVL